jgi:type II secretory pathway pseudopilin PulG
MRARRGITLFEAVAALAIIGVTSVSALAAVGAEMKTAVGARRALVVEALASQRLDFVALMTNSELLNVPDSVAKGQFEKPLDQYKWTTTSTPRTDPAGVYDVVVTVTWPEGSYALHSAAYRRPPTANVRRGR